MTLPPYTRIREDEVHRWVVAEILPMSFGVIDLARESAKVWEQEADIESRRAPKKPIGEKNGPCRAWERTASAREKNKKTELEHRASEGAVNLVQKRSVAGRVGCEDWSDLFCMWAERDRVCFLSHLRLL